MLYEGLKEKGTLMIAPSSAIDSMGLGGLMCAAALQQQEITSGLSDINSLQQIQLVGPFHNLFFCVDAEFRLDFPNLLIQLGVA